MQVRPKYSPPRHKMPSGQPTRKAQSDVFTWPAPRLGWHEAGNMLEAADRLDNWFPTGQAPQLRGGCIEYGRVGSAVRRMFTYIEGDQNELFAATGSDVTNITTPAGGTSVTQTTMEGFTGGDWSTVQFANAGGTVLLGVNGVDNGFWFDGTDYHPLVDEAVFNLPYDALVGDFTPGQTVTGATSGATAEILGIFPDSATAGTLKVGAITGTFQNNEDITDPLTGDARSNIPSGTSAGSTVAITGVATSALSQLWTFKRRVFAVEKNTFKIHYLPVDSIGGAVSTIDLAPIFRKGGSVLFGANWSVDSGAGFDDKCVIVSDQGQVAIYGGTDPASASTWALEGVYDLGKPLDKYSHFSMGGELLIVTDDGVFPLSQAKVTKYEEMFDRAMSAPIENEWQRIIAGRSTSDPVTVTAWHSRGMLFIGTPDTEGGKPVTFVANTRHQTWCRYIGWQVDCAAVHDGGFYFGRDDGKIFKGETGGTDNGTAYSAHYVGKTNDMGTPGDKVVSQIGLVCRASTPVNFRATALRNGEKVDMPNATPLAEDTAASVWGTALWDGSATWGDGSEMAGYKIWQAAGTVGYTIAPGISVTSNQTALPRLELSSTLVRYEVGSPL